MVEERTGRLVCVRCSELAPEGESGSAGCRRCGSSLEEEKPTKHAAVALVEGLVEGSGRILVVWNKRYLGWSLPGGLVEESETPLLACARELREETGLCFFEAAIKEIYAAPTGVYSGPLKDLPKGRGAFVHVMTVSPWWGDPREMEEGCPVTWMTHAEFLLVTPFREFYEKAFRTIGRVS